MKHSVRILAALLGLLVLASCGAAPAPAEAEKPVETTAVETAEAPVSEEAAAFPLLLLDCFILFKHLIQLFTPCLKKPLLG